MISRVRVVVGFAAVCGAILAGNAAAPHRVLADPGPDCPLQMALLCRFLPIAPDLDHDIDLTQPDSAIAPDLGDPVNAPPAPEPCSHGCG